MGGPGSGRRRDEHTPDALARIGAGGRKARAIQRETRAAATQAAMEAAEMERELEGVDPDMAKALEEAPQAEGADVDAIMVDGVKLPIPDTNPRAYTGGHAECALAWGRYLAARKHALDQAVRLRTLIPAGDVRDWCGRVCDLINRKLPLAQGVVDALQGVTDEQREWIRQRMMAWEHAFREELAKEIIQ